MKEIIDEYFTKKYKFLLEVVHNINGGVNAAIPYHLHKEVINELYLYLIAKPDKINPYIIKNGEKGLEAFCVRWIKNQSYWVSDFKKKHHLVSGKYIEYESEKDQRFEDIKCDMYEDEYYNDLLNIHNERQIDNIILAKEIYNTLEKWEQTLFDMYITQNLGYEQISIRSGISKATLHGMIQKLRRKIKSKLK